MGKNFEKLKWKEQEEEEEEEDRTMVKENRAYTPQANFEIFIYW